LKRGKPPEEREAIMRPPNEKAAGHGGAKASGDRGSLSSENKNIQPPLKPQACEKSADITIASIEVSWRAQVRVTLSEWRGRRKVHVREYHPGPVAGTWWPSKQGVALDLERLPELVEGLQFAQSEAAARGFEPR
jgi:hypothetical protein